MKTVYNVGYYTKFLKLLHIINLLFSYVYSVTYLKLPKIYLHKARFTQIAFMLAMFFFDVFQHLALFGVNGTLEKQWGPNPSQRCDSRCESVPSRCC